MSACFQMDPNIPLIVDLDRTLICADLGHEKLVSVLFHNPAHFFELCSQVVKRPSDILTAIASSIKLDPSTVIYQREIIDLVHKAKAHGRKAHLITAEDQAFANAVQEHLQCFDSVKGSDSEVSLNGSNKASWLRDRFGRGFIYVGNSHANLPISETAKAAILIGDETPYADSLRRANLTVEVLSNNRKSAIRDWLAEFRLHQWTKNILVFVPLFLGHIAGDMHAVARTIVAFFVFGLVASATYVINDLSDLAADRRHRTKRFRALAAGSIPVADAAIASVMMIAFGLIISFALKPIFGAVVGAYLLLTLTYSFCLKRLPMLDVASIGALFTLRVVAGIVVNELPLSPWLISFSACFFFSLALAKRHVEVMRAGALKSDKVHGRGYLVADWPLTLALGISTAVASIIIMLLFISESAGQSGAYRAPGWLYIAPACVFLWVQRIWLLSHRMKLDDDPIVFALKDHQSYFLGFIIFAAFILAL